MDSVVSILIFFFWLNVVFDFHLRTMYIVTLREQKWQLWERGFPNLDLFFFS